MKILKHCFIVLFLFSIIIIFFNCDDGNNRFPSHVWAELRNTYWEKNGGDQFIRFYEDGSKKYFTFSVGLGGGSLFEIGSLNYDKISAGDISFNFSTRGNILEISNWNDHGASPNYNEMNGIYTIK